MWWAKCRKWTSSKRLCLHWATNINWSRSRGAMTHLSATRKETLCYLKVSTNVRLHSHALCDRHRSSTGCCSRKSKNCWEDEWGSCCRGGRPSPRPRRGSWMCVSAVQWVRATASLRPVEQAPSQRVRTDGVTGGCVVEWLDQILLQLNTHFHS